MQLGKTIRLDILKASFAIVASLLLGACGGGSGSDSITPVKYTTNLGFGTVTTAMRVGETLNSNLAILSGMGPVSPTGAPNYTSNTASVATVNALTGSVQGISAGTSTITANYAGDSNYKATSVSYVMTVNPAPINAVAKLSFNQSTLVSQLLIGTSVTNAATLTGDYSVAPTGSFYYTSSNPAVATVDSKTGTVTAVSAGTALIAAVYDGDAIYSRTGASYQMTVR